MTKTAQIVSLVLYKYRRYVMDMPKDKAIELATVNIHHVVLLNAFYKAERERGAE